jgi:hypothetical protein
VKKALAVIVAVVKGNGAQSGYYCGAFVVFWWSGDGRRVCSNWVWTGEGMKMMVRRDPDWDFEAHRRWCPVSRVQEKQSHASKYVSRPWDSARLVREFQGPVTLPKISVIEYHTMSIVHSTCCGVEKGDVRLETTRLLVPVHYVEAVREPKSVPGVGQILRAAPTFGPRLMTERLDDVVELGLRGNWWPDIKHPRYVSVLSLAGWGKIIRTVRRGMMGREAANILINGASPVLRAVRQHSKATSHQVNHFFFPDMRFIAE